METEILYCVKPHTYGNKWRVVGEAVPVRKKHSAVLIALGRMSRTEGAVIPFPIPVPVETVAPEIDTEAHTIDSVDAVDNVEEEDEEAVKKALRDEYEALFGKAAHGRTSIERLRAEIEKKKSEDS